MGDERMTWAGLEELLRWAEAEEALPFVCSEVRAHMALILAAKRLCDILSGYCDDPDELGPAQDAVVALLPPDAPEEP